MVNVITVAKSKSRSERHWESEALVGKTAADKQRQTNFEELEKIGQETVLKIKASVCKACRNSPPADWKLLLRLTNASTKF